MLIIFNYVLFIVKKQCVIFIIKFIENMSSVGTHKHMHILTYHLYQNPMTFYSLASQHVFILLFLFKPMSVLCKHGRILVK